MDEMPCYSCSSEFGFLKKEVGCEVCGFSFCSRCCKKQEVPSKSEQHIKKLVCNKCFNSLISNISDASKVSPPLAHKKRMAVLKQSISVDSGSQFTNEKDKAIAERLQRLKRDRIKDIVPTEEDISERLAKLKGMDPAKFKSPPIEVYRPPNMATVVEQAAALMKQFALEADLDSRLVKPEDEIAARLARLRGEVPVKEKETDKVNLETDNADLQTKTSPEEMDVDKVHADFDKQSKSAFAATSQELKELMTDEDYKKIMQDILKKKEKEESDEEEEVNNIVEKFLAADVDVEELDSLNDDTTEESTSKSDKDTTEEFPWCVICTEDGKIRCFDCDSDLYCMRCFKECHDSFDIKDHRTCPYLSPKKPAL